MPRRTNDFQALIYSIQKQLAGTAKVTESKELDNGVEIDICIESELASVPVIIAIECNGEARRATIEWVREMKGKYNGRYAHIVVLVAKSGFTKGALREAQDARMEALTLEQAFAVEWPKQLELLSELTFVGYAFRMLETRAEWVAERSTPAPEMNNSTVAKFAGDEKWHPAEAFINAILRKDFATTPVLDRLEQDKASATANGATVDLIWQTNGQLLFKDTNDLIGHARTVFIKADLTIVRRKLPMQAVKYKDRLFLHSEMDDVFATPEALGEKIFVTMAVENGAPAGLTMLRRIKGRNEPLDLRVTEQSLRQSADSDKDAT